MRVERLQGRACGRPFPIYEDAVATLLVAHRPGDAAVTDARDAVVAHVLATCAGYAYADPTTVATMIRPHDGLRQPLRRAAFRPGRILVK